MLGKDFFRYIKIKTNGRKHQQVGLNEYEKQTIDWEKIVAKHISDQELRSKMYDKFSKDKKTKNTIFKICKRFEHTFQQRRCTNAL